MTIGVYWFYQLSKNRVVYIGSSNNIEKRIKEHVGKLEHKKHHNPIFQRTWDKYGGSEFEAALLEETGLDHLIEREQFWMDFFKPTCNIAVAADSPMRGRSFSEESRQKISDAKRGQKLSEETRNKISNALLGKKYGPHSEETKHKIGDASRGHKTSEETKFKISKAKLGRKLSEETRLRISKSQLLRWKHNSISKEAQQKMSKAQLLRREREKSQRNNVPMEISKG